MVVWWVSLLHCLTLAGRRVAVSSLRSAVSHLAFGRGVDRSPWVPALGSSQIVSSTASLCSTRYAAMGPTCWLQ